MFLCACVIFVVCFSLLCIKTLVFNSLLRKQWHQVVTFWIAVSVTPPSVLTSELWCPANSNLDTTSTFPFIDWLKLLYWWGHSGVTVGCIVDQRGVAEQQQMVKEFWWIGTLFSIKSYKQFQKEQNWDAPSLWVITNTSVDFKLKSLK